MRVYIYIHNVLILAKIALPGQDTELKKAGFDAMPQNSLWSVVGTGVAVWWVSQTTKHKGASNQVSRLFIFQETTAPLGQSKFTKLSFTSFEFADRFSNKHRLVDHLSRVFSHFCLAGDWLGRLGRPQDVDSLAIRDGISPRRRDEKDGANKNSANHYIILYII